MSSQHEIKVLERIIVDNAGPMGKFIIKKSMADIDVEPSNMSEPMRLKLLDLVLERAIFDEAKRPEIRREIISAWSGAHA